MAASDPFAVLRAALASRDALALEEALGRISPGQADAPYTAYARAELALRRSQPAQALEWSRRAVTRTLGPVRGAAEGAIAIADLLESILELPAQAVRPALPYLRQLGGIAEPLGLVQRAQPALAPLAGRICAAAQVTRLTPAHALAAMHLLALERQSPEPWSERVFADVLVPWMHAAAEHRQFEVALALESVAYTNHVQRTESQAWFKQTTGRWIPGLAERMRRFRDELGGAHLGWKPGPVRRVAFYVHNANLLAHVQVLLETLSAARAAQADGYEFSVFVHDGDIAAMASAFARCGVAVRSLRRSPTDAWFERLLALQRTLREENFAACFWITLVTHMAVAFPLRAAPLQGWWSMKYHACDIAEIDARLAMENVVTRKRMEGVEWRTLGTASRAWIDPAQSSEARALRATFGADKVVAASIGRESKLQAPAYLEAVARLLERHANLVFLWTGQVRHPAIQGFFDARGLGARALHVGWVDTRLYAQAIDLFLDSFPFPCGFTLKQAMAAGKPAVLFESAESLETGVAGAITPIKQGWASAETGVAARLCAAFTQRNEYDLYFCARTPDEYVEMASRLVGDAALRAAAGAANRAFIEAFLSSPEAEARKFMGHLDELIGALPAAG